MSNYDSDDAYPHSPGLKPVRPKATPSPSPPPFIPQRITIPSPENVSPSSQKKRKKPNRRKTRPSQGDTVLVSFMAPNRPDIARLVGERALNSDSGSEADEEDMDEKENDPTPAPSSTQQAASNLSSFDLVGTAQAALQTAENASAPSDTRRSPLQRDPTEQSQNDNHSRLKSNTDNAPPQLASAGTLANGVVTNASGAGSCQSSASSAKVAATSPKLTGERAGPLANGYPHEDSLATSPNLRELTIPQSKGSPRQTLPALQNPNSPSRDGPNGSPNQKHKLPSFRQLSELAEVAAHERNEANANGYHHRHSFSSTGQSPTLVSRHFSTSTQRSPPSGFAPLSATSPTSAHSDISTQDLFLRSGQNHHYFFNRRPSQASENGPPYPPTIPSASTADSYPSSDSFSPGSQVTPIDGHSHRMSIDGAVNRTLPPPNPSGPHIQHIPPHGAGGFKCEHPGCIAPPFQTQYLLNSHANVHSQSRPHYCPVAGCPRGENGKGFKRKNEMIRHGLVHASPGYVCPFCPDREHKYPRPDNLQRHVRVHHVDKDKDDPLLREVLAQRPEGGSRGRRRRIGS
ncbi:hypothetical protein K432DRAFT_292156 [Lepidopterella palustris CBS 459.81]|uniref:C2H2-type domain-containing protein n=1 Tax=Lepidopterella palustris CBS 459.81 TaxID=1314670 RepID=A0A8E2EFA7_9PEZI|nr:hypothetical protein K432DRAFT_292156 [Lepidopterella palustris CBS 459.81]